MSRIGAFAKKELGLKLWPGQAEVARSFEDGSYSTLVLQCGRRSGKSTLSDVFALYDALSRDLSAKLRRGEPKITAIIAPSERQAQRHITRCSQLIQNSPRLRGMLVRQTADELRFSNGSIIQSFPASARGLRGDAWSSCVLDEFGWFLAGDGVNAGGQEILDAAVPSLSQFGNDGWLIALSTPGQTRTGAFFDLARQASSGQHPHMLFVRKSTSEMGSAVVSWETLDRARAEDLDRFRREYEADWVDSGSAFLTAAHVHECVRQGFAIIKPQPGVAYKAAIDPAFTADNFALCIGHKEGREQSVIDGVWTWHARGYNATLDAVADILGTYGVKEVNTDQHASEPVREGLAQRHIYANYQPWTTDSKAQAYSSLKVAIDTRTVELPDDKDLLSELCSLTVKTTPVGFPRISAAGSGHDDRAIVVASVVHQLTKGEKGIVLIGFDWDTGRTFGTGPAGDWDDAEDQAPTLVLPSPGESAKQWCAGGMHDVTGPLVAPWNICQDCTRRTWGEAS